MLVQNFSSCLISISLLHTFLDLFHTSLFFVCRSLRKLTPELVWDRLAWWQDRTWGDWWISDHMVELEKEQGSDCACAHACVYTHSRYICMDGRTWCIHVKRPIWTCTTCMYVYYLLCKDTNMYSCTHKYNRLFDCQGWWPWLGWFTLDFWEICTPHFYIFLMFFCIFAHFLGHKIDRVMGGEHLWHPRLIDYQFYVPKNKQVCVRSWKKYKNGGCKFLNNLK